MSSSPTHNDLGAIGAFQFRTGSGRSNLTPDSRSSVETGDKEGGSTGRPVDLYCNRSVQDISRDVDKKGEWALSAIRWV